MLRSRKRLLSPWQPSPCIPDDRLYAPSGRQNCASRSRDSKPATRGRLSNPSPNSPFAFGGQLYVSYLSDTHDGTEGAVSLQELRNRPLGLSSPGSANADIDELDENYFPVTRFMASHSTEALAGRVSLGGAEAARSAASQPLLFP